MAPVIDDEMSLVVRAALLLRQSVDGDVARDRTAPHIRDSSAPRSTTALSPAPPDLILSARMPNAFCRAVTNPSTSLASKRPPTRRSEISASPHELAVVAAVELCYGLCGVSPRRNLPSGDARSTFDGSKGATLGTPAAIETTSPARTSMGRKRAPGYKAALFAWF
jgi:hypothetical protein